MSRRLTPRIVGEMRLAAAKGEHVSSIAARYGMVESTCASAIRGRTWRWVATAPVAGVPGARGERAGGARLTEGIVRAMRLERRRGMKIKDIAAMVGCPVGTAIHAIDGTTWAHVRDDLDED